MMDNEKEFAIRLADNEKKTRDRALAKIRRYIEARVGTDDGKQIWLLTFSFSWKSDQFILKRNVVWTVEEPFVEEDFIKLWKGLHYCMWMCDKPLIQVSIQDTSFSFGHYLFI